jgi:hypothetical protein
MITTDDILELAREYVNYDDEFDFHLDDFGSVCVIHFSLKPKRKPAKPNPPLTSDPDIPPDFESGNNEIDDDNDLIGFGPILIDKRNSKILETGGTDVLYDSEHYAQSYLSCGDPCGEPMSIIDISDFSKAHDKSGAIRLIHVECKIGMQEAKTIIDRAIEGDSVELEARDPESATRLAIQLQQLGISADQRWLSSDTIEIPRRKSTKKVSVEEVSVENHLKDLEDYFSDQEDENT